jgi:hypothetical protein
MDYISAYIYSKVTECSYRVANFPLTATQLENRDPSTQQPEIHTPEANRPYAMIPTAYSAISSVAKFRCISEILSSIRITIRPSHDTLLVTDQ